MGRGGEWAGLEADLFAFPAAHAVSVQQAREDGACQLDLRPQQFRAQPVVLPSQRHVEMSGQECVNDDVVTVPVPRA